MRLPPPVRHWLPKPGLLIRVDHIRPTRRFTPSASGVINGPRRFSYDMTISRSITIAERYRPQLRGDLFNPLNVPMLGAPDVGVINPSYTARNLQVGMRLDF